MAESFGQPLLLQPPVLAVMAANRRAVVTANRWAVITANRWAVVTSNRWAVVTANRRAASSSSGLLPEDRPVRDTLPHYEDAPPEKPVRTGLRGNDPPQLAG